LADYRDHSPKIESMGARVVGVSVDRPEISENLRAQLSLPFPLLCDTEHRVITQWDILNAGERGGIARPAVFVIDAGRIVRFAATDEVVRRVPASEMVSFLQQSAVMRPVDRRVHLPRLWHWMMAIRNGVRR